MRGMRVAGRFGLSAVCGLALVISVASCSAPQAAPALTTSARTPPAATAPTPSTAAMSDEATGLTHAQAPEGISSSRDQPAIYDVAVNVPPATVERCAYLDIDEVVESAIGKSTLTGSTLTNPNASPITACVFSVGGASPEGKEDYISRDFLSVSLNYQGAKDFAAVVQRRGTGEKVALGDEAYWWDQGPGGQLSVLDGATLITVYTFPVNNPPVIETRREALEAIAKKILPSGQ